MALRWDRAAGEAWSWVIANTTKRKQESTSGKGLDVNGIILEHNKTISCLHHHYYSRPARLRAYHIKSMEGKWISSKGNSSPHRTQSSYHNERFPDSDHLENPSGYKTVYGINNFWLFFFFFKQKQNSLISKEYFLLFCFRGLTNHYVLEHTQWNQQTGISK